MTTARACSRRRPGAASATIENARLYRQVRQAAEEFQRRLLPEMPDLPGLDRQGRYQPATEAPAHRRRTT
ncbi:hypothetical protein [Streptomyces wuyuanensis]|uniref:hypothetical protein n=1 Tax=Streptomyces wuyuanensis TaxID=1196353 RepID=UPI000B8720C7|nr:hypothetical protein [Streptomyces wuyuanensis]